MRIVGMPGGRTLLLARLQGKVAVILSSPGPSTFRIRPLGLLPEFAVLRGRLRLLALLAACSGTAVTDRVGWSPGLGADLVVLSVLGPALSIIDLRLLRLPDRIVLPGAALSGALLVVASASADEPQRLARALAAALTVTVLLGSLVLLWPDALGLGDVKVQGLLLAPLLAWGSWQELCTGLAVTLGLAAAVGVWRIAGECSSGVFALGPFLFAGTTLTVLYCGPLR